VVDDTAVTPRYVTGFTPRTRAADHLAHRQGLLVQQAGHHPAGGAAADWLLPWAITPLLMLGAPILLRGREKIWACADPQEGVLADRRRR
jgi:predicted DNA repair protein MutK